MTVQFSHPDFLDHLPHVRGRIVENASLARLSWFRTGGPAQVLFEPADEADLVAFLRRIPGFIPLTVIGVGSNLLVRDGGVSGVVIRLGRAFADIRIRGDIVKAGAAAVDVHVAKASARGGLTGLEFLIGVPGTVGGALRMNAGAYGQEVSEVLQHAHAVDRYGHIHEFTAQDFKFSYRQCKIDDTMIFLSASFQAQIGEPAAIKARMEEINATRGETQPLGTRTGGSTFKNPEGYKAWELIDAAGCRGMRIGGAQVSEKHCNFLINTGDATAADIEELGETVRRLVKENCGIELEWEIQRIGASLTGEVE
ncbi:UDP-N-acetylmuramate dehydrogenase [Kordiimonas pumila]|uniref:UDP-N-acetylenolpyruvoylglucosamine reductase n=1 Tax=Kordiimonas pumila TaxID=2161677 RepID=A0ABV7D8V1_9PROT|nr:UDP-N-acetylmuramate dehydrogenase [Kordiimonas pumila]